MEGERGRPFSEESSSSAVNRQRRRVQERLQRLREQQRHENITRVQPTSEQLQQGEQVVSLTSVEQIAATPTLPQVGLRVQNVVLAQDAEDAHLQQNAQAVDEHCAIYDDLHTSNNYDSTQDIFQQSIVASTGHTERNYGENSLGDPRISQYFRSLPLSNPSLLGLVAFASVAASRLASTDAASFGQSNWPAPLALLFRHRDRAIQHASARRRSRANTLRGQLRSSAVVLE